MPLLMEPLSIVHPSRTCTLGIHDEGFSKQDVLLNDSLFVSSNITNGTLLQISPVFPESPNPQSTKESKAKKLHIARKTMTARRRQQVADTSYVFRFQEVPAELLTKHPNLEVSILQSVASALGFTNRSPVVVSKIDQKPYLASHVEIAFRDAYLTRTDMWRLIVSELAGKSIYKGQKLVFLNSIKAQVKSIYRRGSKITSGFFASGTKPIFRSESSRYVIFIQMSREMWDFEAEGSGEIMFHKVVNDFLPELFRRWQDAGAHHLVSIILFTRMEYEETLASLSYADVSNPDHNSYTGKGTIPYRDFYHVSVSDMASDRWSTILTQLKKEFKTFLRDVSIRSSLVADQAPTVQDHLATYDSSPSNFIGGRPAPAIKGNILQAINTASSQFSEDHIDRDLVRTGLSIVIITPGTGVFEVDPDLLTLTTDTLIENGVGIDLVCLARMPLHSVPLFVYRHCKARNSPVHNVERCIPRTQTTSERDMKIAEKESKGIYDSNEANLRANRVSCMISECKWNYAIPHWVDVSFWTSHKPTSQVENSSIRNSGSSRIRGFLPRVKMYEIQMMGVLENEASSVAIPSLDALKALAATKDFGARHQDLRNQGSYSSLLTSFQKGEALSAKFSHPSSFSPKSPNFMNNAKSLTVLVQWMEGHDERLFQHSNRRNADTEQLSKYSRSTSLSLDGDDVRESHLAALGQAPAQKVAKSTSVKASAKDERGARDSKDASRKSTDITLSRSSSAIVRPTKGGRQASLGFRGFGNTMLKANPVIEISSEVAHRESLLTRSLKALPDQAKPTAARAVSSMTAEQESPKELHSLIDRSTLSKGATLTTKPIAIRNASGEKTLRVQTSKGGSLTPSPRERQVRESKERENDEEEDDLRPHSSLTQALAPWFTVLNPSNPSLTSVNPSGRLGRWHHVFPRPLHASNMKWKSLCAPASIPLTTEGFPALDQLRSEYDVKEYIVSTSKGETNQDQNNREWLMRELVGARFSRGFQVVVGNFVSTELKAPHLEHLDIFDDEQIYREVTSLYMSKGSQIHELKVSGENSIDVRHYARRLTDSNEKTRSYTYTPAVKTTLSKKYNPRTILISTNRDLYDWEQLDTFIAGQEKQHKSNDLDLLGFWRARYVFIPVDIPSSIKRVPPTSTEDNDEEVRLEGIYRLTQIWQKYRHVSGDLQPRKFKPRVEDVNPLDIIFRTRSPSAIVASELYESLLENAPNDGTTTNLLPEIELLDRSDTNLSTLAQILQSERGIKLQDRRWHLRLHYNCFIGIEFVTWLVQNFRDIQSRDEATDLGNELMREGLFVHVERRHNFRDGNYFYQISPEYRAPRAEPRGWFQRLSSVPSTPISETRNSPGGIQSQSIDDEASDDGSRTPTEKVRRTKVTLSKQLVYDVDRRKKSYRKELINLHYDRISSADDCYHVRIDWLNVTPKLIEDAVALWASTAERYGLRLVELPINEASRADESHMFRSSHTIKLARPPPETPPRGTLDATSFTPKPPSSYPYQRALLRKFDFVLDLEAATDFPSSVDVSYSWGKPDYQYPQFISRDGTILAQITDDGNFLLLANRLLNDRGVAGRSNSRPAGVATEHAPSKVHRSPARLTGTARPSSPHTSPYASPLIHATQDVGSGMVKPEVSAPMRIKDELEAFCSNPKTLEKFYEETLHHKNALTNPNTPEFTGLGDSASLPPVPNLRGEGLFLVKTSS